MKRILFTLTTFWLSAFAFGQTPLPTSWGFLTPPITSPPNGWTPSLGTNGNLTYSGAANSVGDGIACRLDATDEYLKIWFADTPGELSYFIKGTGIPPAPAFNGTFSVQESTDDVTYTDLKVFTTAEPAPGSMTRFAHNPAAASRYIRFYYTAKVSGSNIALDSVWIKAAAASPNASINVKIGANTVVNQSTTIIGNTALTNFTIENMGTVEALSIDSVRFSGPAASDYSVQGTMPTSVAALTNQNLGIGFAPGANGTRMATMKIYNSDPAKNPYTITLYGIGGQFASEPNSTPGNLTASNTTSYNFRLALTNFTPKPDNYIVLRKMGSSIADVPVDGVTYKTGDWIGQSVVAYVGDSAFSNIRPTYIFANSSYSFACFGFNGPAGFENYQTNVSATTQVETNWKNMGTYYNGIDPNASTFLTDLSAKINPHDTVYYSLYASRLMSGFVARDTTGGKKVVNCVYTDKPYIYEGSFVWWTGSGGNTANLTREHTFAQSWMPSNTGAGWPNGANGKELPEYNDMHHLFPADQLLGNAKRSNFPFGNVVTPTYTSPTGHGKLGLNASGQTVWEPKAEHKGDLARALMYMSVCYNGIGGRNWKFPATQSPAVILQWHLEDTASRFEVARHEYIFAQQKNRNPFIDHPEWYNKINFTNMTLITGIEKIDFSHSIATWPIPASEKLNVDVTLIFNKSIPYEICDTRGVVVKKGTLDKAQSVISMPENSGVYFLRMMTDKGLVVNKLIRN